MNKIRWRRIILILILVLILGASAYWGQKVFSNTSSNILQQNNTLPDGSPINLPSAPKTPATMSDAERESAIEQARNDAMDAAKVSGQNDSNVQQAGEHAEYNARKAFYPAQNNESPSE